MAKDFIAKAIKKPGALHSDLGVPQKQKIPPYLLAQAAKQGGVVGQRARFAQTLAGFQHGPAKRKRKKRARPGA